MLPYCVMRLAFLYKGMHEKTLNVRMPDNEILILTRYAAATGRTKTEIVREFVRSLESRPEMREAKAKTKTSKR